MELKHGQDLRLAFSVEVPSGSYGLSDGVELPEEWRTVDDDNTRWTCDGLLAVDRSSEAIELTELQRAASDVFDKIR